MEIEITKEQIEEDKKQRKENWLKKNSWKSQRHLNFLMTVNPELGEYIKVNQIEISNDFFPEEYKKISEGYYSVMEKMKKYFQKKKMRIKKMDKITKFLVEINNICEKYNLSISHENNKGSFVITNYDMLYINWLRNAKIEVDKKENKNE